MLNLFLTILLSTSALAQGRLKKVNYQNETSEKQDTSSTSKDSPVLTPEQSAELNKQIEAIKKNQTESAKILKELDEEE